MKKLVVILLCVAMFLPLGVTGFTANAAETVIYVKDGGTGDGTSEANAYGDFLAAFDAAAGLSGDAKLIVVGTVNIPFTSNYNSPLYDHLITVVGKDDSSTLYLVNDGTASYNVFNFGGDTVIDDITLTAKTTKTIVFCANLRNITFGHGFKSTATLTYRGTYKHNETPGLYGYNDAKTSAVASYTLTIMGGSWKDVCVYSQYDNNNKDTHCNLNGTVTVNVGGGAIMTDIIVARGGIYHTARNVVINIHDAVIRRTVGATDRNPTSTQMGYDDTAGTVTKNSGVSESMVVNVYPDFDVSASFQNTTSKVFSGISGTSIVDFSFYNEKYLTDVESLGTHTLNIDAAVYDDVIGHVQTLSFDTVNNVNFAEELSFSGASLTLQNNLKVNFCVKKDAIIAAGCTDLYTVFEMNGNTITVNEYSEVTSQGVDYYVFSFSNIAPNLMNDTIFATLHATKGGVPVIGNELPYSIAQYCYSMLGKTADAELRALLVDLLNYGAAVQTYTGYNTASLVNGTLTTAQSAWGTAADPVLTSATNAEYHTVGSPAIIWAGASLKLNDSITMQFVFTAASTEGVTVKIKNGSGTTLKKITAAELTSSGGYYIADFKGLTAGQMSETVYVTAYNGDTAISNTFAYSIESYAYAKQNDTDANLADLVKAMMKYGNAAYNYAN